MLLKDVKVGEVYLVVSYGRAEGRPPDREHAADHERAEVRRWFEELGRRGTPYRVLKAPVPVPGYQRKGVECIHVDRDTLEPWVSPDGKRRAEPEGKMAVSIVMPWTEFYRAYHEHLDAVEEWHETRRVEREREQQAKQEAAAARWRTQEFEKAKRDIEQVAQVFESFGGVHGEHAEMDATDAKVRLLVELRHPDGNPYENGRYTA